MEYTQSVFHRSGLSAERKSYTTVLIVAITHYETITMFDV